MSRRPPKPCQANCGRPVRQRRGAAYCSPCIAKIPKRTCVACDEQFHPDMMNGPRCRPCASSKAHEKRVGETFGLKPGQYQQLLAHQGGVCFICHRRPGLKRLAVDHDHACCPGPVSCGKCVRGLLCRSCNRDVLGHLKDDTAALLRAVQYLEHWPSLDVL